MSAIDELAWMDSMTCKDNDPDELFLDGAAQTRGKRYCSPCTVKAECLAYAMDRGIDHGVWGAKTSRERRELARRNPSVTDWKGFIQRWVESTKVA